MVSALGSDSAAPHWTSIDWEAHHGETVLDGRRLRFVDIGRGSPVLLVHGLGASWQTWLENIPDLARDHRVVAVDLPGFGGSDPLSPSAEISEHADTLAALLDALGIERVVAVGHSLGGVVCERLALGHPDKVHALLLACAGGVQPRARERRMVRALLIVHGVLRRERASSALRRSPRLRRRLLGGGLHDPTCVSDALINELLPGFRAPGFIDTASAGLRDDVHRSLHRIACRTLIVWGRKDRLVPVAVGRQLADLIPGARLEIWDEVGHCPMLERPADFNELLRDWVIEIQGNGVA